MVGVVEQALLGAMARMLNQAMVALAYLPQLQALPLHMLVVAAAGNLTHQELVVLGGLVGAVMV
jgi:hypothetical protein